jgi:cytochrome d ubiquinol oxidase subunit II
MVGLTSLALFMMHGAIFLLMKTEGRLFVKLTRLLRSGIIFFILMFTLVTLYTLIYIPHLSDDFKSSPALFIAPILAFLSIANIPRLASKRRFKQSFLFSALSISFLLILVAIELYPVLILSTVDPAFNIDIYSAASSEKTLGIMLIIAAIGVPLVLLYTFFVYKTFWGKVIIDETSY